MPRKSEAIDILKLYSESNYLEWNAFLTRAHASRDIAGLTDVLRRLQMGMDNLVQQKLNTDKVVELFIRLQRSVENTIRDIHRAMNPNPLFFSTDKTNYDQHIDDKRKKQNDLENFLHRVRY